MTASLPANLDELAARVATAAQNVEARRVALDEVTTAFRAAREALVAAETILANACRDLDNALVPVTSPGGAR